MECSREIYCVADHSKFDKGALLTFADLKDVHTIITDSHIDPAVAAKYEQQGVRIEKS